MGRLEEAEDQYKLAIELDTKNPNAHGAYSLLLASMNYEKEEDAFFLSVSPSVYFHFSAHFASQYVKL